MAQGQLKWHAVIIRQNEIVEPYCQKKKVKHTDDFPFINTNCDNLWQSLLPHSNVWYSSLNCVDSFSESTQIGSLSAFLQHYSSMCNCKPNTADAQSRCLSTYRKISSRRPTKYQNVNDPRLTLQLSLPNPLKPGVKSRMKM